MKNKPFRALLLSVITVILATAPLSGQTKRVALVIGNGAYAKIQSLNNPANDAVDMTAALQRLGFTVLTKTDADHKTMRTVIDDFNKAIQGADVALFYYSGHGVQLDNENYLVPVGADVSVAGDVPDECVSLSRITARMNEAGAGTNIIILDACRDNPFKAVSRGIERGLAVVAQKPPESIIIYATAENEKAEDGGGRNGTFTSALLKNIERPESFMDILTDVNSQVRRETQEKQKPAVYESLSHRVYLAGAGTAPTPAKKPNLTVEKSYGSVTIVVRTGGTLYLNGIAMGQLSPGATARLDDIEAGRASLLMLYADGRSETQSAEVAKDTLTAISFTYIEQPKLPELFSDLLAYYRLDDTTIADSTGVHNGTNHGAILSSPGSGAGYFFSGNGTYVDLNFGAGKYASLSVQAWVRTTAGDGGVVTSRNGFDGNLVGLYMGSANGTPVFYVSRHEAIAGDRSINDGRWHHIVGVYDGSAKMIYLYVDGIQKTDRTTLGSVSPLANFYLGWDSHSTEPFRFLVGNINEVGIWDRALSAAEVIALYNSGQGTTFPQ